MLINYTSKNDSPKLLFLANFSLLIALQFMITFCPHDELWQKKKNNKKLRK